MRLSWLKIGVSAGRPVWRASPPAPLLFIQRLSALVVTLRLEQPPEIVDPRLLIELSVLGCRSPSVARLASSASLYSA